MKIVMIDTAPGSVDGINTAVYQAGVEYDLTATSGSRDLARAFLGAGLAEKLGAKGEESAREIVAAETPSGQPEESPAPVVTAAPAPVAAKPGRKPKAQ